MKKVCGYIEIKNVPYSKYKVIKFRGTDNEVVNRVFESRKQAVQWLEINEPRWIIPNNSLLDRIALNYPKGFSYK